MIAAVASRSEQLAVAYGQVNAIPVAHGSYETLLDDDSIDLVYNALPPSEHARWSIGALESGKHVLCEKPIAMNAAEAEQMASVASRTGRLIEAFHDGYHPSSEYLLGVRESGELGQLRWLDAAFTVAIPFDRASIRHDPALGGGALIGLGCYPVHWVRFPAGEEPEVDKPVLPHNGHSVRITTDGVLRTLTIGAAETHDYQLDAVVKGIVSGEPLPTEDFVANMKTIDAINRVAGLHLEQA